MKLQQQFKLSYQLALVFIVILALLPGSSNSNSNRVQLTTGYVVAVGVETDKDGNPKLAEYDSEGFFVSDIPGYLGIGDLKDVTIYSAAGWRAFEKFHLTLQSENPDATQGAQLMSAEQYNGFSFKTRTTSEPIKKPELLDTTKSVYVISEDQMLVKEPIKANFILAEYPIGLHQNAGVNDKTVSLILNDKGEVVRKSDFDVSLKAAVYKEDENGDRIRDRDGFKSFWQPIPNIPVSAGDPDSNLFPGGLSVSQDDGQYSMVYILPPCPGFVFEYTVPIIATLNIENFNPKATGPEGFLPAVVNDYKVCVGLGEAFSGASLQALNAQLNVKAIVATLATPIYDVNVKFSTMQLNVVANFDATGTADAFPAVMLKSETKYAENSNVTALEQGDYKFDFNLDGEMDTAFINQDDPKKIDIYYSGTPIEDESGERRPPDITRIADVKLLNQLDHQGLLSEISKEDLKDTDIYIYRRSTGQRIGTIEGLLDPQDSNGPVSGGVANEKGQATYRGIHDDEPVATFGFTSFLVGAVSNDLRSSFFRFDLRDKTNRRPWQDTDGKAGGFTTENPPDSLRPGEVIQVIAINRATGYLGTQDIIIQPSGTVLEPPTPIVMLPPNLKIIASRQFDDFNELTRDDDQKINIIGNEGAGLTSDDLVKIQTVWLNNNGDVLPDDLPGYTGRVAISTGSETTDFSAIFDIKPGYQTQVVQLNNAAELTKEHFYVQVIGEHINGEPNFGSPGAGEGKLQTRPEKYVPVLVPLFDEASTRAAEEALAIARIEGLENLPERVEPTYRWVYRPEMQFSVYELAKQQLQFENAEGDLQVVDLSGTDKNAPILVLNDNMDFVELLYDLLGPDSDVLPLFSGETELVFSLGAEEVLATIGDGKTLRFDKIDHLSALVPEDFLNIRLYTNNDMGNVLWQWVFGIYTLFPERNYDLTLAENTIEVSADDAGEAPIVINAFVSGAGEEQLRIDWEVDGAGSVSTASSTSTNGIFNTELSLSTQVDATAFVSATIQDQEYSINTPTYKVVPGLPALLEVTQTGSSAIGGNGAIKLEVTVKDQYQNLVPDGTVLSIYSDDVDIENITTTMDGIATFDVIGRLIAGSLPVEIKVGNAIHTEQVQIHDIQLQFANLSDVQIGTQTTFDIQATSGYGDLDGIEINVAVLRGKLSSDTVTLDSSGSTQVVFDSGRYRGFAQLSAKVDNSLSVVTEPFSVLEPDADFLQDNILVVDGSGSIDLGNGLSRPYSSTTNLVVHGQAGETINPTLASIFEPAVYALLDYNALGLVDSNGQQIAPDYSSGIDATGNDLQREYANSTEDNLAWVLNDSSYISVPEHSRLQSLQSAGVNFRINLGQTPNAGTLIDWDDFGVTLLTNADGTLTLTALTGAGPVSVTTQNELSANQWHQVAAHVFEGELKLGLDGEQVSVPLGSPLAASDSQNYALRISVSGLLSGAQSAKLAGLKVYDWQGEAKLTFANGGFDTGVVLDSTGTAQIPLQAHPTVLSYTRSYESTSMLASISGRMLPTAYAQTAAQQACLDTFAPISPDAEDPIIEEAEHFLTMALECFVKPRVEEARIEYQTAAGFRKKSVALVRRAVMEGAYAVLKQQKANAIVAANCLDAALTGSNASTVGATCDFITSLLAIGDLRDLLIQSWHYSIGDASKFDPLTASLAGIGLLGSGATLISGPAGGSVAVVAATGKVISKTFKRLGPVGQKAADTLGAKLGKILDDDNLTIGGKVDAVLRYSPIIEIGGSLAVLYGSNPKVFKMFGIMLSKPEKLDRLLTWLRGYLVRLGEEVVAGIEPAQQRFGFSLIPTADAAISQAALKAIDEAFELFVAKSDVISIELLTENLDTALKEIIEHLDEAGELLKQGAIEGVVIKSLMNIKRIAGENAIRKFVKLDAWRIGDTAVDSKAILEALAELPEEAMEEAVSKGLIKVFNKLDGTQINFVKGEMFELASYLSAWKRGSDGEFLREIVDTQRYVKGVEAPSGLLLPNRYPDQVEKIGGKEVLVELKNYLSTTWKDNFVAELSTKLKQVDPDEAVDVVSGQLLTDLVRHVEHVRNNPLFPNPTARRMSPDVLEAGESVADKQKEMNLFVFEHIKKNQNEIAKTVWGLDLSKRTEEILDEWDEILEVFREELIDNDYVKIDALDNLTG